MSWRHRQGPNRPAGLPEIRGTGRPFLACQHRQWVRVPTCPSSDSQPPVRQSLPTPRMAHNKCSCPSQPSCDTLYRRTCMALWPCNGHCSCPPCPLRSQLCSLAAHKGSGGPQSCLHPRPCLAGPRIRSHCACGLRGWAPWPAPAPLGQQQLPVGGLANVPRLVEAGSCPGPQRSGELQSRRRGTNFGKEF